MICGHLGKLHGTVAGLQIHQCGRFNRSCTVGPNDRIVDAVGTRMLSCEGCQSFHEGPLPPAVDVIVTSHNYGHYLDECLASVDCTSQVIVVDDASNPGDQTKAVCDRRGASYLRTEFRSPHLARGAAFALCKSPLVCFLDADNTHQPGYLAAAATLFAANARLAIVYPDMQFFGDRSDLVPVPEFNRDRIEQSNCIDTGSVWLREAIDQSQLFSRGIGFQPVMEEGEQREEANRQAGSLSHVPHEFIDWWMARQIIRSGRWEVARNPIPLNYRVHPAQASHAIKRGSYYDQANFDRETVTVFTTASGRVVKDPSLWDRRKKWLLDQSWPRDQIRLVVANTSHAPLPPDWFEGLTGFAGVAWYDHPVGQPLLETLDRRNREALQKSVDTTVAAIYNRMAREVSTEFVVMLEDDVFPEPLDTIQRLLQSLSESRVCAVTGAYRLRFNEFPYSVWSSINEHGSPLHYRDAGQGVQEIEGCGLGCVALRMSHVRGEVFAGNGQPSRFYDVSWCYRLRQADKKILINWDVPCDHVGPRFGSEPVGDYLHMVLAECGINRPSCEECVAWRKRLNAWGVSGCTEHRAEIIARLNHEAAQASWLESIGVASHGYLSPAAILDEALNRAKRNAPGLEPGV